ncbi:hypothetical protein CSV86_014755 [Pseudomonas putida CSV86]|uniref:Uncharacterized protein n=1 Tax=Pseudomonas bharatica CSV86 TaxID=1005395 RepID=L1M4B9_9PSED|nr:MULTISPECIES: hypothetical protein [Pseudomonas]NNJ16386.1 hypothetical protein [Pseudomonas bharatica CSV86]WOB61295.1 hypothetical protein NY023_12860 [Pseudomonas sp. NBB]
MKQDFESLSKQEQQERPNALEAWKETYAGVPLSEERYSTAINAAADLRHRGLIDFQEWLVLIRTANAALRMHG